MVAVVTSLLRSRAATCVPLMAFRRSIHPSSIATMGSTATSSTTVRSFSEQYQLSKQQPLNQSDVQIRGMTFSSLQQQHLTQDDESRCAIAYCLSFSNDESDFQRNFAQLDAIMKAQLEFNQQQFQSSSALQRSSIKISSSLRQQQQKQRQRIDTDPLPRTLEDALRSCKTRSIVITEKDAPFRIVNVNTCWEQLCGYSYVESKGKTLGSLLRGPQTDPLTATTIIAKLLQGEPDVGATLINYKKGGQPFFNRIRAGPIYNEDTGRISHFVGLLQEVETFGGQQQLQLRPIVQ